MLISLGVTLGMDEGQNVKIELEFWEENLQVQCLSLVQIILDVKVKLC